MSVKLRLPQTHDMSKLPTGVEIRGKYIRIWFMFRGKRCRETLKGWEITNSNIKKAGNLRALIVHEISSGEFEYLRRFPQSSTGAKMVTTRVIKTFGELCDIWTKIKETELTTNTMKKTKSQLKTLRGNDSNLLIVFYVQIMPDDLVMQLHRF